MYKGKSIGGVVEEYVEDSDHHRVVLHLVILLGVGNGS